MSYGIQLMNSPYAYCVCEVKCHNEGNCLWIMFIAVKHLDKYCIQEHQRMPFSDLCLLTEVALL